MRRHWRDGREKESSVAAVADLVDYVDVGGVVRLG